MIKGNNGVTEMTAKSEMVYGRLLFLGGKGELVVMRYACLWQNALVQILVTYTRVRDKKRLEKVGNLVKNSYLYR